MFLIIPAKHYGEYELLIGILSVFLLRLAKPRFAVLLYA